MLDLSSYGCILLIIQLATVRALSLSSYHNDIWFMVNRHYYCR
jgi:hypothetical protein